MDKVAWKVELFCGLAEFSENYKYINFFFIDCFIKKKLIMMSNFLKTFKNLCHNPRARMKSLSYLFQIMFKFI